jgi:hypothetical protein
VPGHLTEITEIVTGLGTLGRPLDDCLRHRPDELANVPDPAWERLVAAYRTRAHPEAFAAAHGNGAAFLAADDGLRRRRPRLIEWKGPHRNPGDDVIPADLRIDHVYLISCKYMSRVLMNAGPARLFDRLLVGEERRAGEHWFAVTAPQEYQALYALARDLIGETALPALAADLAPRHQQVLRRALADRTLPPVLRPAWQALCAQVSACSAERWRAALSTPRARLHLLWRLLRVSNATYFVLGTDRRTVLRMRVASTWDWNQRFELRTLTVEPQPAGQPKVAWRARIEERSTGASHQVAGHVEIRWSHGRFNGAPEAKVYLDGPHADVPGYEALAGGAVP